MTNLRHPSLRIRDIIKIIRYKHRAIKWDRGSDEKNEYIFASLENEIYKDRLLVLLSSKNIPLSCKFLSIDSSCYKVQKMRWEDILSSPESYFENYSFHFYDIDLKWVLEYSSTTQVARFGRIS
jgi:hypothetical protein